MKIQYFTSVLNAQFNRPAVRLHTVNVIEITNGDFQGIRSFADTPEGNKRAERLFKRLVKEFELQEEGVVPSDAEDMQNYLNDGIFESGPQWSGYQLLLTHST